MKWIKERLHRVNDAFVRKLLIYGWLFAGSWLLLELCVDSVACICTFRLAFVIILSQLPIFYFIYSLMFTGKLPPLLGLTALYFWKLVLIFGSTALLFYYGLINPISFFLSLLIGVFLVTFLSLHLAVRSKSAG